MSGLKYNYENHGTFEDFCGTKDKSFDALGLSNFALISSPYETRLLDSILELSNDQSEIKHQEGCNSLESCFCYPAWIPDDSSVPMQASYGTWIKPKVTVMKCEYKEPLKL
jgi:hypothetical protein